MSGILRVDAQIRPKFSERIAYRKCSRRAICVMRSACRRLPSRWLAPPDASSGSQVGSRDSARKASTTVKYRVISRISASTLDGCRLMHVSKALHLGRSGPRPKSSRGARARPRSPRLRHHGSPARAGARTARPGSRDPRPSLLHPGTRRGARRRSRVRRTGRPGSRSSRWAHRKGVEASGATRRPRARVAGRRVPVRFGCVTLWASISHPAAMSLRTCPRPRTAADLEHFCTVRLRTPGQPRLAHRRGARSAPTLRYPSSNETTIGLFGSGALRCQWFQTARSVTGWYP